MLAGFVTFSMAVFAMPTPEQTKKVESLVVDLMRDDQAALKSGKKTRVEVAESAMSLADQAESEAAKLLLMKGAFNLYVRAGEFDRAIETLQSLQTAIPDIPPANMASIIESSLRSVPRKNGGQLYRLLDETKTLIRYTNEAASLEKSVKKTPAYRTLRLRLAEHYAYLGKWDLALENFAAAGGTVGTIAKSEREGEAVTEKIANFWWDYPTGKAEELVTCFHAHAAMLYKDAIAAGKITGLNKVQAERRIGEVKECGESVFAATSAGKNDSMDPKKYCVIDISKGSKASRYSVTYMAEEPKGGWTDEYKGTKLVLRKIPAGTILIEGQKKEFEKEFYAGVFEVTQKQLELVTGKASWEKNHVMYGFNRPAVNVDFEMIRGKGKGASVDNDSFIGLLRKRTGLNIDLPTVSEWIYFGRAGSESPFNNGGSTEDDLKMLGRYKGNKNDGKGGYADGPSAVGMYIPNTWGIYDIHGGVSEWCLDNGIEAPIRNPKWGEDKVVEKQRVVMGAIGIATSQKISIRVGFGRWMLKSGTWVSALLPSNLYLERKLPRSLWARRFLLPNGNWAKCLTNENPKVEL